ncbi:MAG: hypothetical protein CVV12_06945 [Gammaproteobacteria bacterium HGW-Gammaproteobacteria-2]|jgi:class III poly(R)-hydroxyalkanoic acid synthase PhaE subunit|nr:MAG: hypothetical protein CVV12_06945 [Gammaproteobacteria bacterium HGW-Gammaproteobacteria-2]
MTQAQDGLSWLGDLSDNWSQAMTAWQSLAKAVPGVEDAMSRIAEPSQAFSQFMAALGPGLGEGGFSAAELTRRWRETLETGASGAFTGQFAQGVSGFDLNTFVAPMLEAFRKQVTASLDAPAFGPGREQQERWQALVKAQLDNQQAQSRYQALLGKVIEKALAGFESKLTEHEAPGRQLGSLRAIYDLWIDAAEESYAQIALSPEFGVAYGEMVNAQMRLRAANQNELERVCRELGMPTRSEVTATHRKVHALERSVRALRAELADKHRAAANRESVATPGTSRPTEKAASRRATSKPAAAPKPKPRAAKKAVASLTRKAAAKPRKPPVAKAASRRGKGA